MSQYGHYTMTCGRYIKRGKMSGKCLFLPLKGPKSHAKYYFLTPGGPIYLPIKYRNFAQNPFNYYYTANLNPHIVKKYIQVL